MGKRHRSGRKPKFTVCDEVQFSRIMKNRRGTLDDITSAINNAKDFTFYSKTVRSKLFKMRYNRRVKKKKMVIRVYNRKNAFLGAGKGVLAIEEQPVCYDLGLYSLRRCRNIDQC